MSLTSVTGWSFLSVNAIIWDDIQGRTLSRSTKGLNLVYMPQDNVKQGDDAHLGAMATENLCLACLHKGK